MANEIKVSSGLTVNNDGLTYSKSASFNIDMTHNSWEGGTVDLGSPYQTLPMPAESSGVAEFVNLSTTEWLQVGTVDVPEYGGNFTPFMDIPPSTGPWRVYLSDGQVAARSMTITGGKLEYKIYAR